MLGYIIYGDGPKKPAIGQKELAGGSFMTLTIREEAHAHWILPLRRVRYGLDRWREAGVRQAVFPMDFPYTSLFIRQGICPVDTLPLRRALAAPLIRERLGSTGPAHAVVAIVADRVSREVAETVRALSISFRYVMLSARSGGEELSRQLRREYGISLLLRPALEQLERADALLLYCPCGGLSLGNRIVYTLYPGGESFRLPLALPRAIAEQAEPNCDLEQLAAALYGMGAVTLETLLAEIPC